MTEAGYLNGKGKDRQQNRRGNDQPGRDCSGASRTADMANVHTRPRGNVGSTALKGRHNPVPVDGRALSALDPLHVAPEAQAALGCVVGPLFGAAASLRLPSFRMIGGDHRRYFFFPHPPTALQLVFALMSLGAAKPLAGPPPTVSRPGCAATSTFAGAPLASGSEPGEWKAQARSFFRRAFAESPAGRALDRYPACPEHGSSTPGPAADPPDYPGDPPGPRPPPGQTPRRSDSATAAIVEAAQRTSHSGWCQGNSSLQPSVMQSSRRVSDPAAHCDRWNFSRVGQPSTLIP